MTATDEQPPKITTDGPSDPQPLAVTSSTNPEPHESEALAVAHGSESVDGSSASHTPASFHTSSEVAALPTHNDPVNAPISPDALPADPKVATLLGMFPDFDVSLLQSVLQSVSGDQDRAIDVLLGMSDPEYTPTARPDVTQTELDEAIARRLMLEETEQHQRAWQPHAAPPRAPYQQRSQAAAQPPQGHIQQSAAEGEGMAQFQEQLGKIAETGKKTFNALFSKVKAKIQEFDNPATQRQQPSGSGNPLPRGDSWNNSAQAQSYYDPNPSQSVEGYNGAGAEPPHGASMNQEGSPGTARSVGAAQPATTTPTNPAVPTGNVDPSKIGLLPKRPVSLGSSPQPSRTPTDDELEYVENPFEESNRR